MKARLILCVCVVLVWAGALSAVEYNWTGAIDTDWSNPDNWLPTGIPTVADNVRINNPEQCVVSTPGAVAMDLAMSGVSEGHLLIAEGGELTYGRGPGQDWMAIGWSGGDGPKVLEVLGTLNCSNRPLVGWYGNGVLIIDQDGVFNVQGAHMEIAAKAGSSGTVELRGGTLNLNDVPLYMARVADANASMDFSGGQLVRKLPLAGDDDPPLADRIADGSVTAYGGVGQVVVDTNEATGLQVIKGLHPLNPVPEDGDFIIPGTATLSWTVPEGTVVDVWFGTSDALSAAQQLVTMEPKKSVDVEVDPKTRYYWAVDVDANGDGEITEDEWGLIFSFKVDNKPPVVIAADDVTTWIPNGSVEVPISAVVIDDDPTTVEWTVLSQPEIGNQMEDSGFESAALGELTSPWITNGNTDDVTITIEQGNAYSGNKNALMNFPADASGWRDLNQTLNLQSGTNYTMSAMVEWANPRAGETITVNMYAYNWETGTWQGKGFEISGGGYTELSHVITAEGSDDATTKIYVQMWNQADVQLRVDDFKLIAGTGSGEAAMITDPTQLETTVVLSAVGTYVLQCEASDGEYTGSDIMTINVYSDGCEAAKSLPGYELIPGDINEDCVVDELDQAIMMENWLKCNALDCIDPNNIHGE